MIVAVIVLAFLLVVAVALLAAALQLGLVEWSSSTTQMSHYFAGPHRRDLPVEEIPCRCVELVFGRICVEVSVGRWTR